MSEESTKRTRRMAVDPLRRERIVEAALQTIEQKGVKALTHRAVAKQANVPLGSTTYYFETLSDILEAAFILSMERDIARMRLWGAGLGPNPDLPEELASLLMDESKTEAQSLRLNFELTFAAVGNPKLMALTSEWNGLLAELVEPYVGKESARVVAVVHDGAIYHQIVNGAPASREETVEYFRRACSPGTF